MTYVELIVVLGIFSVMLSIALFNYKKFQSKVDLKNLANDIALKIVEAQKSSTSGKLVPGATFSPKPSYGVYLNSATPTKFLYYADLNNSGGCDNSGVACTTSSSISGEVLDIVNITKGNTISSLQVYGSGCASPVTVSTLNFSFKRPASTATITQSSGCTTVSYVDITITSPQANTAHIKLYPSGRIQIN
jgi:Tfp pilus assembly protein FimT